MLLLPLSFSLEATYFSNGGVESTVGSLPDGKNLTISYWIRINDSAADGTSNIVLSDGGGFAFAEKSTGDGARLFALDDPGTTTIVNGEGTGTNILSTNTQGWLHVLMSVSTDSQFGSNGRFHIYLNDTNETSISGGVSTLDGIMNWDAGGYTIGSNQVGTQALNGCLAEVWVHNTYLDLDQEANRRLFIGADGGAVNLSDDGSNPLGLQPFIYFTGSSFSVNNGSLADPDVNNGVQTECENAPPESTGEPAPQPPGEVNVTIVNPFDGSFQGGTVFVNYTQSVGTPEVFQNASLLLNGTVDQTQTVHNNFTASLADGHHNITVLVFSNASTFDQDSVIIIVDTINPFDNLNTIIGANRQIDQPFNYTITATNSNLILHNVTVYDLTNNILLSQQDQGALGTTNDITIELSGAFFTANAPGTFNITSRQEDNATLSSQTSVLLTIIPPTVTSLACNGGACSDIVPPSVLDNAAVVCDNVTDQTNSFILSVNGSIVINDLTADTINGNTYFFNNTYAFSSGDHNATALCTGINGQDTITEEWTISDTPVIAGFALWERASIPLFKTVTIIFVLLIVGSVVLNSFRGTLK